MNIIKYKKIPPIYILLTISGIIILTILSIAGYHSKKTLNLVLKPEPTTSQYLYQSKSKGFAIYLGNRSIKQIPEVKFVVENSSIDFQPEGNISDQTKLVKDDSESVVYKNIYPDIDLKYTLIEKGIKEEIILNNQQSATDNHQFSFKLNLKNAINQKDLMSNAAITFIDPVSGDYLFHFEKPFMIDAGGNRSEQVDLKVKQDSLGFRVVITPDANWLKTAIYPVIIDPTVVLDNTDTVANWTSSNSTYFTPSQDTGDKQEGTGSVQVAASSVTDDVLYYLKSIGTGGTSSITTKYANIDLEMEVKDGNQTISADTSWGNATADTRMLGVRVNGNLTVDATKTLTAAARKRGMAIYVTGDLNLNGIISMTARGANAAGQQVLLLNDGTEYQVAAAGGAGTSGTFITNDAETFAGIAAGATMACGGGQSGRGYTGHPAEHGSAGTSYSGGNGGNGYSGDPGAKNTNAYGTGGLLALFVDGNLSIGTSGAINSTGSLGAYIDLFGGGSGGGSINVFYKGSLTGYTSAKLSAVGKGYWVTGGNGTARINQSDLAANALNETLTRDLGAGGTKDLSGYSGVSFWVKSTRTGTYLQFGMGESAWNDNTTNITINSANTWEQKTWDISGITDANKNAIRYLGFKTTNADSDFTFKFDDINAVNMPPTASDSLLTNGQTNPINLGVGATSPYFSAVYNDPDATDIADKYEIQVDDNSGFGSPLWDSGSSGTAMSDCNQGDSCQDIVYGGSTLTGATTYYWRIKYWDDEPSEGAWSTESATFTVNYSSLASTSLLTESLSNPTGITDTTPELSAIYNDPDIGDIANKYRIQVDNDSGFGSPIWDSGSSGTAMSDCNQGDRCSDISYGGAATDLQWNTKYYWRIKYWDDSGFEGAWNTESAYFTMIPIYEPTSCMLDDSSKPNATIFEWNDNTNLETAYRIERSVDSGAWTLLSSEAANTVSYNDETTLEAHTYLYRVRAESSNGNSQWCGSSQVDYSQGNLKMQGIIVR